MEDHHPLAEELLSRRDSDQEISSSCDLERATSPAKKPRASQGAEDAHRPEGGIRNKLISDCAFPQSTYFANPEESIMGESDASSESKSLAPSYEEVAVLVEELQEAEVFSQRDNSNEKAFSLILAMGSYSLLTQKLVAWSKEQSRNKLVRIQTLLSTFNQAMAQVEFSFVKAKLLEKRTCLHFAPLLERVSSLIGNPHEMMTFSEEQTAMLKIFIRLELAKQYKKDKDLLDSLVNKVKRKASNSDLDRYSKIQSIVNEAGETSKKALNSNIESAKEALAAAGIKFQEFEGSLRTELLKRHERKDVNQICSSLKYSEAATFQKKLQNESSSKSTPIDGKRSTSDNSVVNQTSLKKRDFQEFKKSSQHASAKSSPGSKVKKETSSRKMSPAKKIVTVSESESEEEEPKITKLQKVEEASESENSSQRDETVSDGDQSIKSESSPLAEENSQDLKQMQDMKDHLDLDSHNNEFSFNNGAIEAAQQSQKLSQKSSKKGGKTLRVGGGKKTLSQGSAEAKSDKSKKKKQGKGLLEEDEINQAKPQSQQNSDVELELDSDKLSLEKRDQNGDGPSWNKSYVSNNLSQISSRSNIDELQQQFAVRRRNNRGRNFIARSSTIMNIPGHSQSQSTSRPASQMNSRINSARGTPRSKAMPSQNRLMTDFMPQRQHPVRKYDTPRAAPYSNPMGESSAIYQQLKAQGHQQSKVLLQKQNLSPPKRMVPNPAGFRAPMRKLGGQLPAKRVGPSPMMKQQVIPQVPRKIVPRQVVVQRQVSPQKKDVSPPRPMQRSPQKGVVSNFKAPVMVPRKTQRMMSERTQQQLQKQAMAMGGKQSVTPKKLAQLMQTTPQVGKSSVRQSAIDQRFNNPEDLF